MNFTKKWYSKRRFYPFSSVLFQINHHENNFSDLLIVFIHLTNLAGSVKAVIKAPNEEAIEGAPVELIDVKTGKTHLPPVNPDAITWFSRMPALPAIRRLTHDYPKARPPEPSIR